MGKDSVIFKELAGGREFDHAPINGQHKLDLVYCREGATRVGGWTWKEWEVGMIGVYYMKFPNDQKNILHWGGGEKNHISQSYTLVAQPN